MKTGGELPERALPRALAVHHGSVPAEILIGCKAVAKIPMTRRERFARENDFDFRSRRISTEHHGDRVVAFAERPDQAACLVIVAQIPRAGRLQMNRFGRGRRLTGGERYASEQMKTT